MDFKAAPAADSDSFVLDMATTTVALGKLEVRQLKNDMSPVPPTWLADENGLVSANIRDVLEKNGKNCIIVPSMYYH